MLNDFLISCHLTASSLRKSDILTNIPLRLQLFLINGIKRFSLPVNRCDSEMKVFQFVVVAAIVSFTSAMDLDSMMDMDKGLDKLLHYVDKFCPNVQLGLAFKNYGVCVDSVENANVAADAVSNLCRK